MRIGPWFFVGWPGEAFVEFALMVKASHPNCYVISMANGELQGYLVTEEAMRQALVRGDEFAVRQSRSGNGAGESDAGLLHAKAASQNGYVQSDDELIGATRGERYWRSTWERR